MTAFPLIHSLILLRLTELLDLCFTEPDFAALQPTSYRLTQLVEI